MSVLLNVDAIQAYIKEQCKRALNLDGAESDFNIDIALKRQMILDSTTWRQLSEELINSHFDPYMPLNPSFMEDETHYNLENLQQRLDDLIIKVKNDVKEDQKVLRADRSSTQRLIRDYYFPRLYESRKSASAGLRLINDKLETDPENHELQQYKRVIESNIAYLDSLAAFPFALEKTVAAISQNQGINYTPRQNAQIIASMLDTLQKSQAGHWKVEKLVEGLKVASKVFMPDLPADAFTLEAIKELLPYVNTMIENGNALKQQKADVFPRDDKKKAEARSTLLESMGIKFDSLATICHDTLLKPAQDATNAIGSLAGTVNTLSTEDGLDYIKVFSLLDQVGDTLHGMPQEFVPGALQQFSDYYQTAKEKAGQVTTMASQALTSVGQVLGETGAAAYRYTPDVVKSAVGSVANQGVDLVGQAAVSVGPAVQKVASTAEYLLPSSMVSRLIPFLNKQSLINIRDRIFSAAAAFIPNSIKERMAPQKPESLFWESLKTETDIEPQKAEAYMSFSELAETSNSPALEEVAFQFYMKKNGITSANYDEYTGFKETLNPDVLTTTLKQQLELLQGQAPQFRQMLDVVHKLSHLEKRNGSIEDVKSALNEINEAAQLEIEDTKIRQFQTFYLKPALQRSLVAYEKLQFGPGLEKALDMDASNSRLRQIYSKLEAGHSLPQVDLAELRQISGQQPLNVVFTIDPIMDELTTRLAPAATADVGTALTPNERSRETIQGVLDTLVPVCRHVSEGFQKQLEDCQRLRALCPEDPLKSSCDAKITYLQALQRCNAKLLNDMRPGGPLSEQIRKISTGEIAVDLTIPDATSIAKHLLTAAWEVALPKNAMVNAGVYERMLAYALSNNEALKGIIEAKREFEHVLDTSPPPAALMTTLGDPLNKITLLTEGVAGKSADTVVNFGVTNVVTPLATYYVASTALGLLFPHALIAEVATGILTRASVQKRLGEVFQPVTDYLKPLTSPVTDFIGDQQKKLSQSVKNYICPMLNIEVQKVIEQKAFDYALAVSSAGGAMDENHRSAFAGLYLQYRVIKENNPNFNKEDCIKYLFSTLLEGKEQTAQADIVQKLSNKFQYIDNAIRMEQGENNDQQEDSLEDQLRFFINNVDFKAPDQNQLVVMSVFNQLLMKQFEAAKQFKGDEARKLGQKPIANITTFFKALERMDASSDIRTYSRAEPILPAAKQAAQLKLVELLDTLGSLSASVRRSIKTRDDMMDAHRMPDEPRFLGRNVAMAEIDKSGITKVIMRGISKIMTPVSVWASIAVVMASKGFVTGLLTAAGVAGVTAGTIATAGFGAAVAVLVGRVAYTTAREVRARSKEFSDIQNSNDSPLKKFGLTVAKGLKCFGIGLVKSVMIDTVYRKITGFFDRLFKPIAEGAQAVRNLARAHPAVDVLETETSSLRALQSELDTFKDLVTQQIKDKKAVDYDIFHPEAKNFNTQSSYEKRAQIHKDIDDRGALIEQRSQQLREALDRTQEVLQRQSGNNDARWVGGANQELDGYKNTFAQLNEVMDQVNLIKNLEKQLRPKMRVYEKELEHVKKQLGIAENTAATFLGEREAVVLSELSQQSTAAEMDEIAAGLREKIAVISEATAQAEQHARSAITIANETGGEVGVFTSIKGTATIAQRDARLLLEHAAELDLVRRAKEFLIIVDDKIAQQRAAEAQVMLDQRAEQIDESEEVFYDASSVDIPVGEDIPVGPSQQENPQITESGTHHYKHAVADLKSATTTPEGREHGTNNIKRELSGIKETAQSNQNSDPEDDAPDEHHLHD
jgi:hypothetical protein